MHPRMLHVDIPGHEPVKKAFFNRIGSSGSLTLPKGIQERAEACLETARTLSKPRAVIRLTPIETISDSAIHAKGLVVTSTLWAGLAGKAVKPSVLAVFALTLGKEVCQASLNAREDTLADAFFLDQAGSEIIEQAAGVLETQIKAFSVLQGLQASNRFSPGYCDLSLDNQTQIFQFLPAESIHISLNGSGAMLPYKSITSVMLFAEKLPFPSPCATCRNKTCHHRRADFKNQGKHKGR